MIEVWPIALVCYLGLSFGMGFFGIWLYRMFGKFFKPVPFDFVELSLYVVVFSLFAVAWPALLCLVLYFAIANRFEWWKQ